MRGLATMLIAIDMMVAILSPMNTFLLGVGMVFVADKPFNIHSAIQGM